MKIGDRIKMRREELGLSQEELALKLGYKDRATVSRFEKGERDLKQKTIYALAQILDCSPAYLLGINPPTEQTVDNKKKEVVLNSIPFVGKIACGNPCLAIQQSGEYYFTDADTHADFCLRAVGDSMRDAGINDGDLIFCRKQETVENGEIAALLFLDGAEYAEATLKRFFYYPGQKRIILIPENPNFPPLTFVGKEMEKIKIIGKAVVVQSKIV